MLCVHCATRPFPQVTAKPLERRTPPQSTSYKCAYSLVSTSVNVLVATQQKHHQHKLQRVGTSIAASWSGRSNNMHLVHDNLVMPCTSCMGPQQDS